MYQQTLTNDLIVDNFAGGGGASCGIEMALGRPVNVAINHDPAAIGMHRANHPMTLHLCQDVFAVKPREVTNGRQILHGHFSPDCKHFSKAKGAGLVDRKIRDLAWVVLRWASLPAHERPLVITLENVEEFITWGPTIDGKPDPKRKGITFRSFVNAIKRYGYVVEWRELRACDYGAPTIRKRLFLVARCDGGSVIWPKPTHGNPKKIKKGDGLKPWRTAAECIDWSIPCPSIFDRKRPLKENTLRRVARGIKKFVLDAQQPFIVNLTHGGRLEPIDEPLRTTTCAKRGEKAIAAPFLAQHNGGFYDGAGRAADEPLATIATRGTQTQLVAPYIVGAGGPEYSGKPRNANEPLKTVPTNNHSQLVAPFLAGVGGRAGQSPERGLGAPTGTITAKADTSLVAPFISKMHGTTVGSSAGEPLHTVSAGGTHHAQVNAHLIKYYGTNVASGMDEPMHTVTVKDRFGLAQTESCPPPLTETMAVRARMVADLMRHFGLWDEREFVTFDTPDGPRIIYDIGMRMLVPRELARAQGFPDTYIIDRALMPDARGVLQWRALTKTEQVRMIGNSVSPPPMAALVRANHPRAGIFHQAERRRA